MHRYAIQAPTDVSSARRDIVRMANALGYDATLSGEVAIVVTELAQNMLRHAGGGEVLAGSDDAQPGGIEILALDCGPGIVDIGRSLEDGYSTGGGSGTGLGAIRRLSRQMLFHVVPDQGTAILVRMGGSATEPGPRDAAAVCVPKPSETVCGDSAAIWRGAGDRIGLMLADGLGHGTEAARASGLAAQRFLAQSDCEPTVILADLHDSLRATRGAALAVARIDRKENRAIYGGIGNISGLVLDSGGVRRMVSHSGTAGHVAGRIRTFEYPMFDRPVVIMFSDGLVSTWSPDRHVGLFDKDPMLIAAVLYRDHNRGRDDASVLVWKG